MTERQICEKIIEEDGCYSINCLSDEEITCPLCDGMIDWPILSAVEKAKKWLRDYEGDMEIKVGDKIRYIGSRVQVFGTSENRTYCNSFKASFFTGKPCIVEAVSDTVKEGTVWLTLSSVFGGGWTYAIKDIEIVNEFNPKRGDEVLVWNTLEAGAISEIFLTEIKGSRNSYMCVSRSSVQNFKNDKLFEITAWKYIKPIPKENKQLKNLKRQYEKLGDEITKLENVRMG